MGMLLLAALSISRITCGEAFALDEKTSTKTRLLFMAWTKDAA
jgi:hypothetical protein